MTIFFHTKRRLAKVLSLLVLFGVPMTTVQAQKTVQFTAIDSKDTLLVGIFSEENYRKAVPLLKRLQEANLSQYEAGEIQKEIETTSDENVEKYIADLEKKRRKQLTKYEKMPDNDQKKQAIEVLNKMYDDYKSGYRKQAEERRREIQREQAAMPEKSEYSTEQLRVYKQEIAALTVDGKLHNYVQCRDFYHGRAAVARVVNGKNCWGFVDSGGREVIACRYRTVFDFNNRKYYKSGGAFEVLEDWDDRPWTTAWQWDGYRAGMIDDNGRVVISFRFKTSEGRPAIRFHKTPWGEFASVYDPQAYKVGIIDRNGNYTLKPVYENIVYYNDLLCFGTTGEQRIYFDPHGNKIEH